MNNCPFCEIERQRLLKETNLSWVILSNPRLQRGHLLILPKRHLEKLSELATEEKKEIFDLLALYQEKILAKLGQGSEIRQNYKPYFPNNRTHVNHLHFHLLPRDENDELAEKVDKHRKPLYKDLSEKEREDLFTMLS